MAVYILLAYIVLPALWTHHEHQKGLAGLDMVTRTRQEMKRLAYLAIPMFDGDVRKTTP